MADLVGKGLTVHTDNEKRAVDEHFLVNMDRWVDDLDPSETISTSSVPLSESDINILLEACENKIPANAEALDDLKHRLEQAMEKYSASRLDSALKAEATFAHYDTLLKESGGPGVPSPEERNRRLTLLYQAMGLTMKVHRADDALQLLFSSRRILWDLQYYKISPTPLSLIVREWAEIPLPFEFRCFVYNNRLTAISQYFGDLYFDLLHQEPLRQRLAAELVQFWQKKASVFSYIENEPDPLHVEQVGPGKIVKYIVDLAIVTPDPLDPFAPGARTVVLEVNPFNISTGSVLFSWESEADCEVLFGRAPFEFRVNASIPLVGRNKMHPEWSRRVFA